jgi:hypothetical protein
MELEGELEGGRASERGGKGRRKKKKTTARRGSERGTQGIGNPRSPLPVLLSRSSLSPVPFLPPYLKVGDVSVLLPP